jgi:hypothetical protein
MKPFEFSGPGGTRHARQTYGWLIDRIVAAIRSIMRAVANDHALALTAAAKAESSRAKLAGVRALYLSPQPHLPDNDSGELRSDRPRATTTPRSGMVDFQAWSAPLTKSTRYR